MSGKVTGWTPQAAKIENLNDTDGVACSYTLTAGNTIHHVAELITPILNEKEPATPPKYSVKDVRESIVKFNNFSQEAAVEGKNENKTVFNLQPGFEVQLPANYAAALKQANEALPAAQQATVTQPAIPTTEAPPTDVIGTGAPQIQGPLTYDPPPSTAPAVLAATCNGNSSGTATTAEPKPAHGPGIFGKWEQKIADAKKARETAKTEATAKKTDAEKAKTADDTKKLADFKTTHADPKYKTVLEYIADRPNEAPDKVLTNATKMVAAINEKETAAAKKVADADQAKAKADTDAKAKADKDAKTKEADAAKAKAKDDAEAKKAADAKAKADAQAKAKAADDAAKDQKQKALAALSQAKKDTKSDALAPNVVLKNISEMRTEDAAADAAAASTVASAK